MEVKVKGQLYKVEPVKPIMNEQELITGYSQEIVLFRPKQVDEFGRNLLAEAYFPIRIFSKEPQNKLFIPGHSKGEIEALCFLGGRDYTDKATNEKKYFLSLNLAGYRVTKTDTQLAAASAEGDNKEGGYFPPK